jgi:predicted nuclease of predicted toxin-antitoxin system
MKLLVDMNLSPRWVLYLASQSTPVVHWSEIGDSHASDVAIMAFAKQHDYVVLTNDLDFSAILAATQGDKPSVVQIRSEDLRPNTIGEKVRAALLQLRVELDQGALLTIDASRTRVRLLPLSPPRSV